MSGPCIFYDNRLRDATPVASSVATGYSVLNLRDMRTYTFFKPNAMPATVTVDCGSSKNVDSWNIYGHDLGSKAATVELRRSTDNFAANDVLVDTHTPADDKPINRLISSTGSRYWRFRFTGASAPTIAIAQAGMKLEIPEGLATGFDPIAYKLQAQTNRSIGGHALGKVINYREWKQDIKFELVSWTWVRDTFQAAARAWLDAEPFLFSWNIDTYPKETYHVMIPSNDGWRTPHRAGSLCDLIIPLQGVIT